MCGRPSPARDYHWYKMLYSSVHKHAGEVVAKAERDRHHVRLQHGEVVVDVAEARALPTYNHARCEGGHGGQGAVANEGSDDSEEHGSGGGDVECGQNFRSDKSMFGHLGSHPEQGYKGSTPPAMTKLLLNRDATWSPPVDDGRRMDRYSRHDPNLNAFEILAAYVILTLKHRDSRIAQDQPVTVETESDVQPEEAAGSVLSNAGAAVAVLSDKHGSSATPMEGDDKVHHSEHGSSAAEMAIDDHPVLRSEHFSSATEMAGDNLHSKPGGSVILEEVPTKRGRTKKSKEARRKEKDVASASKARRPYICKHCNAVFPMHMAGHNRDRRVQAQNEQAAASASEVHHQGQSSLKRQEQKGGGGGEERRRDGLSASARVLVMERYTRLFNTGRRSRQETGGGFKRQHTGSERKDGRSLPPVVAPVADGDRRRLFGVDLNAQATGKE